ncbi:MAG: hypothetical protein M3Y56_02240 [Armatimonadota bacterium]|nr:hypothetical protein [Armatimonadota bacterium]
MSVSLTSFKSLIVRLEFPCKVLLFQDSVSGDLLLDGVKSSVGTWSPWPVAPDILYHRETGSFAGLSCFVHETSQPLVRSLSSVLQSPAVRYNTPEMKEFRRPYGDDPHHYLEILWGETDADSWMGAQMAEDRWYYREAIQPTPFDDKMSDLLMRDGVDVDVKRLFAVGVTDLTWLLDAFGELVLPKKFRFPVEFF